MKTKVYKVIYKNGVPTIPESVYYSLLNKGITEAQIQASLSTMSREMVKRGVESSENLKQA